jgi:hypothetical protein
MKLSAAEVAYIRSAGLYLTDRCNGCGKPFNQSFRYTIAGKPQVYCSAGCRDLVFFDDPREAKRHSRPGKCVYCGGNLQGKRRDALYCDEICKKRVALQGKLNSTARATVAG